MSFVNQERTGHRKLMRLPDGLVNSSLPTILVSCKCDNPENTRQIDVTSMEAACGPSCFDVVKTAGNVPESARLCLSAMLRAVMAHRNCKCSFPLSILLALVLSMLLGFHSSLGSEIYTKLIPQGCHDYV